MEDLPIIRSERWLDLEVKKVRVLNWSQRWLVVGGYMILGAFGGSVVLGVLPVMLSFLHELLDLATLHWVVMNVIFPIAEVVFYAGIIVCLVGCVCFVAYVFLWLRQRFT